MAKGEASIYDVDTGRGVQVWRDPADGFIRLSVTEPDEGEWAIVAIDDDEAKVIASGLQNA